MLVFGSKDAGTTPNPLTRIVTLPGSIAPKAERFAVINGNGLRVVSPSAGLLAIFDDPIAATGTPPPLEVAIIEMASTKTFGLFAFDQVATKRIHGRPKRDRLAVNSKHCFVARVLGHIFDVLVVESVGNGETIHLDAEPLFERFLASADFILQPLFVFGRAQFFLRHLVVGLAQILVRFRMRLNIDRQHRAFPRAAPR